MPAAIVIVIGICLIQYMKCMDLVDLLLSMAVVAAYLLSTVL